MKKIMILFLSMVLSFGLYGCTAANGLTKEQLDLPEHITADEDKIADFSKGIPEGFWARHDRGNGGMFDCSFHWDHAVIEDNLLYLKLTKEEEGYVGAEYRTHLKYSYGFYSVSMKPMKCSGVISSFFIYTNHPWDEIDIEFLGNDTTKIQFNYFLNGAGGHEYIYDLGFDASEEFHEYGFDWQPDSITWYVDGVAVYRVEGDMPSHEGHIMMNLWNTADFKADWAGKFDESGLPGTAQYEWIGYSNANSGEK